MYLIVGVVFLGIALQRGYRFFRKSKKNRRSGLRGPGLEGRAPVPEQCQTIEIYRKTAGVLPRPSENQIDDFIQFVSSAHSWYKHLPLVAPGVPFYFFLNPHAACDVTVNFRREVEYRRREKRGFHYSEWPTSEYLKQCGYLDYQCAEAVGMLVLPVNGPPTTENLLAQLRERTDAESRAAALPEEILLASTINLTGIIHPYAASPRLWHWRSKQIDLEKVQWPSETGGRDTLVRVIEIAQHAALDVLDDGESFFHQIDALIDPERRRLKQVMRDAIKRMLELVYGPLK